VGPPRGVVQPWGLIPIGGRCPNRASTAVRAGGVLCSSKGGGASGRWHVGPARQREREGGEARGHMGRPVKRNGVGRS
jgi:hypothetical protein